MFALATISTNHKKTHPKRHSTSQTIHQKKRKTRDQTAIDCSIDLQNSRVKLS